MVIMRGNCHGIGISGSDTEALVERSILSDISANLPGGSLLI